METKREDFMTIDLVQEERERIKAVIKRKFEGVLIMQERRNLKKAHSKNSIPFHYFRSLQENIFFLIDNPNYKRLGEKVKELEAEIIRLKEGVKK